MTARRKSTRGTARRGTGRAAIYLRISEDKSGVGAPHQRQLDTCRKLALRLGLDLADVEVFTDTESATNGNPREGFNAMLASNPRCIIVWHTDRLVRLTSDLERVIALDVNVHAVVAGDLDLSTPSGRMVGRVLTAIAQNEGEHKAERQRARNRQRAESGMPIATSRAFGYTRDGMALVPVEADAIRKAYADYLAGYPLAAVARDWNAANLLTVRGNTWTQGEVHKILRRPRNAALVEYQGEIIADAKWPAIVDRAVWNAAQRQATDPSRRAGGGVASALLTGIARCHCGSTVRQGQAVDPKYPDVTRVVYRCNAAAHNARTRGPIDELVTTAICARLSAPDARDVLIDADRPDVELLRNEAAALRDRLDQLAADYADGLLDRQQVAVATPRLRARLAELDERMTHAGRADVLDGLLDGEGTTRQRWDALPLHRQRAVVEALCTVTLHRAKRGPRFDRSSIAVEWHTAPAAAALAS